MSKTYEQLEPVISALDERIKTGLGAFPTDTAEGSIASFPDGADSIPMKDVLVHIEPVQDLHGYDSPWPAGGAKNKLPNNAVSSTVSNVVYTVNSDGTITANGTSNGWNGLTIATFTLSAGSYIISSGITSGYADKYLEISGAVTVNTKNTGGANSFTLESDGEITVKFYVRPGYEVSNLKIYPMIRLASVTDSTFAPYSNICPVTGWTGAKMTRAGKNLLPNTAVTSTFQGVTYAVNSDGSINANGTSTGWQGLKISEFTLGAGQYKLLSGVIPVQRYYSYFSLLNGSAEIANTSNNEITSFTISEDTTLTCRLFSRPGAVLNNVMNYPMILLESDTDTTYTSFAGYDIYDITFPTEAGTVYGGTLDVTKGELVVDRAIIASYAGESLPSTWISDRDVYREGATPTTGAQVCYYLVTPITYHLTPTEIKSLLGENTVWADAGDTEVTYRADSNLYIEKKMAGTDIPMIADSNIVSGSYFMIGSNLYKATANIASGSAVIVGTNCTQKSLATALNEINQ